MEIWKDIKGYEGKYQVSNYGNVKSMNYHRERKEKILSLCHDPSGYPFVLLYKNGKRKQCAVHRLVADAFLNNENGLPCINHKDENKQNNHASNLEFCTVAYNNRYSKDTPVAQCDLEGNPVKVWGSIREASETLKVGATNISACCRKYGRNKTAGGFIWRYAE